MKNYLRDQNNTPIMMYCVDCRLECKEWEDSIAVVIVDGVSRCMEHFDDYAERNHLFKKI